MKSAPGKGQPWMLTQPGSIRGTAAVMGLDVAHSHQCAFLGSDVRRHPPPEAHACEMSFVTDVLEEMNGD
jgi:hypothetical protein